MSIDIKDSVLAMYDIRGKQDFIFRTNKLKEIAGGSWIIRDCFNDYLFDEAEQIAQSKGIFYYKDRNGKTIEGRDFTEEKYLQHLEAGYIGEVVYDGGGNFLLLLRSEDTFKELTYRFTKRLMEEVGTLRVLGSCVPVWNPSDDQTDSPKNDRGMSGNQDNNSHYDGILSDYQGDNARLYEVHRRHEMEESIIAPWSCLPIVQVDRQTSQPLIYPQRIWDQKFDEIQKAETISDRSHNPGANGKRTDLTESEKFQIRLLKGAEKCSRESLAKRRKYLQVIEAAESGTPEQQEQTTERYFVHNEKIFDNLVTQKGEDSLLAVVYIDGNRIGAKVQDCLKNPDGSECRSYEDCVRRLRAFSDEIQAIYVDSGIDAVLKDANENPQNGHRLVVYAGDEVNFVVNAHDAYDCAKRYLQALPEGNSACAGIAVFHSHAPYADVYSVAEECCESGKKQMKKFEQDDACYIDWHICQGGVGVSLEQLRKDADEQMLSRPWLLTPPENGSERIRKKNQKGTMEDITTTGEVEELAAFFRTLGRNNVKDLAGLAQKGASELSMDLMRIKSHSRNRVPSAENNRQTGDLSVADEGSNVGKPMESEESPRNSPDPEESTTGQLDMEGQTERGKLSPPEAEAVWTKLGLKGNSGWKLTEEHYRKLIYDTVLAYDLWFAKGKTSDGKRREGR